MRPKFVVEVSNFDVGGHNVGNINAATSVVIGKDALSANAHTVALLLLPPLVAVMQGAMSNRHEDRSEHADRTPTKTCSGQSRCNTQCQT